ncbi:MAG: peptidyl-tRNA hydrolase Pth2 [Candidatus Micrarchaeota archaeon]
MGILNKLKIKNLELKETFKQTLKQAIVVRTDLKMGKGKLGAQIAHASLSAYLNAKQLDPELTEKWINEGMKKIVLKVNNESELFLYFKQATDIDLPVAMIYDAGLTQIKSGSATCFGIGPSNTDKINKIVGKLKLL